MLNPLSRLVSVCAMVAVIGACAASPARAALLSDDFNGDAGTAPDPSVWTTYHYSGSGTNQLDGNSHLVSNVNTTAYGNYVGTVSNASDFDAFTSPLTIQLDGIAVGGSADAGHGNEGWVLYGRSNSSDLTNSASEYHADYHSMAYGMALFVKHSADAYTLVTQEYSNNTRVLNAKMDLDGAPTGVTLVIDGANQSVFVTLAGTTFTDTGINSVTEALSSTFTAANLSVSGVLTSRIALGALNANTVTTASTFSVDSINVTVPEPATLGLVGVGLAVVMVKRKRRPLC